MAKSSRSRKGSSRYRRRKRQQNTAKWLPWIAGSLVVVIAAILVGRRLLTPSSPGSGARAEERLLGASGTSYDAGPTDYPYPDPAGLGAGHQWLPSLGSPDAPVVVVEYSDIFCGHCRNYNLDALPSILKDYVANGQVRYVDHYFGFANTVQQGAVMAEMCAAAQGRYFEFKHALFQSIEVGNFNIDRAARVANLDTSQFNTCREQQPYAGAQQEMAFVDNQGVNSTPTFFINGKMISGNVPDRIRELIDEELAAQQQ